MQLVLMASVPVVKASKNKGPSVLMSMSARPILVAPMPSAQICLEDISAAAMPASLEILPKHPAELHVTGLSVVQTQCVCQMVWRPCVDVSMGGHMIHQISLQDALMLTNVKSAIVLLVNVVIMLFALTIPAHSLASARKDLLRVPTPSA